MFWLVIKRLKRSSNITQSTDVSIRISGKIAIALSLPLLQSYKTMSPYLRAGLLLSMTLNMQGREDRFEVPWFLVQRGLQGSNCRIRQGFCFAHSARG